MTLSGGRMPEARTVNKNDDELGNQAFVAATTQTSQTSVHRDRSTTTHRTRIVYLIAFLDLFAASMLTPLLRQRILDSGIGYTGAGFIGSVYAFCQLFSGPVLGDWSDHFGRGRVMFISILLSGLGYFLLSPSNSIIVICASRIICGCFKHTQTLCKAFLADLDAEDIRVSRRKKSDDESEFSNEQMQSSGNDGGRFGPFMTISTLGFVFGPIIGGHISEFEGGFEVVAVMVAALFFANALLVGNYLSGTTKESHMAKKEAAASTKSTFFSVIKDNGDIFLVQFLVSLSVMVIRTNYIQYVQENFGVSIKWAGYLTGYQALLGVVGGMCLSTSIMKWYPHPATLMLHTTIALGISLFGIAFTSSFPIYVLCLTILNFVTPFSRMANMNQILDRAKSPEHHGSLMGTHQSIGSCARLSSSAVSGIAQDLISPKYGSEVVSIGCVAIAVGQLLSMKRTT